MIDVENLVIDTVSKAVKTQYSSALIVSDFTDTPASFPCVSIMEIDNSAYRKTQDNDLQEHHVNVMYEISVYSNKTKGAKSEVKAIMNLVDTTLQNIKFTRTFKQFIPNKDKTISRMVARFEAVIAEGKTANGNTVYQVYRK